MSPTVLLQGGIAIFLLIKNGHWKERGRDEGSTCLATARHQFHCKIKIHQIRSQEASFAQGNVGKMPTNVLHFYIPLILKRDCVQYTHTNMELGTDLLTGGGAL